MVLFMKGVCSNEMFVGSTQEEVFFSTVMYAGRTAEEGYKSCSGGEWCQLYYLYYYLYIICMGIKHVGNNFSLKVIFMM